MHGTDKELQPGGARVAFLKAGTFEQETKQSSSSDVDRCVLKCATMFLTIIPRRLLKVCIFGPDPRSVELEGLEMEPGEILVFLHMKAHKVLEEGKQDKKVST